MWPRNFANWTPPRTKDVVDFLHALDDHDDVHHVYAAMK